MSKILLNPGERRTFLKTLANGGLSGVVTTLPGTWSKPVVSSMLIPGHAETTCNAILTPTALVIPGTTINVCEDVFESPQHELYTIYTLTHHCGQLSIAESSEFFGSLEVSPDRKAVGPSQVMIYRRRLRENSGAPAQVIVFTALGVSSVNMIGCDDASAELIAGIYSEDEVPLNVEGQSYSVKVTMQRNVDPLQLILADLVVH